MKENATDITVLLDRSGSMSSLRNDTIGGVNTFLAEQKAQPGEATVTLIQFDHEYQQVYDALPVKLVLPLTVKTYVPRGGTALLDAIGRAVTETGVRLAALPEDSRPMQVIFLIQTDGQENASRVYTSARIKDMITHQRDKYAWEFVFLGANQDAFLTAESYGMSAGNAQKYAASAAGTNQVWAAASAGMSNYRSAGLQRSADFFKPGLPGPDPDDSPVTPPAKDPP